jgi:protein-tyrosine-phosphatase
MAEGADLVVTMSSSHREAVGRLAPTMAARTFTLKELVHLLAARSGTETSEGGAPDGRIAAVAASAEGLRRSGAAADLVDEDIPDPLGLGPEAFRAVAWQIETLTERLVDSVFGPSPSHDVRTDDLRQPAEEGKWSS